MAQKFTPANCEDLIQRLDAGVSIKDAASATGIRPQTVHNWLRRGRTEDSGPFADFARRADEARERGRNRKPMDRDELIRVVSEAARKGNTQAMKLRWEIIRHDEAPAEVESPKVGSLDELAERRLRAA